MYTISCILLAVLFICFILFACFFVVSVICMIFKSSYEIFKISKEYYSYCKYRHDLDYILYLQEKASTSKINSKEYYKKSVWVSKIHKD